MGNHDLFLRPSDAKEIEAGSRRKDRQRIVRRIRGLAEDPRPPGSEKVGGRDLYRVRQGDDRVVHEVDDGRLAVIVIRARHRRDVDRR